MCQISEKVALRIRRSMMMESRYESESRKNQVQLVAGVKWEQRNLENMKEKKIKKTRFKEQIH